MIYVEIVKKTNTYLKEGVSIMTRVTSIEELDIENLKEASIPIIKDAIENPNCIVNADLYGGVKIIVHVPYIEEQNSEYYGLYMSIYEKRSMSKGVNIWIAKYRGDDFTDGVGVGEYPFTMSLDEIISTATNDANRCDFCKEIVGLKNLTRIAFANKSCPKCASDARKECEYPGWNS